MFIKYENNRIYQTGIWRYCQDFHDLEVIIYEEIPQNGITPPFTWLSRCLMAGNEP